MNDATFAPLASKIATLSSHKVFGRVTAISRGLVEVQGLDRVGAIGDQVAIIRDGRPRLCGEILNLDKGHAVLLTEGSTTEISVDQSVEHIGNSNVFPSSEWVGHILDHTGKRLDGVPLKQGTLPYELRARPPEPMKRRPLGPRLDTGYAAFDTFLPLARGQRLGLFAGSGVGKEVISKRSCAGACSSSAPA